MSIVKIMPCLDMKKGRVVKGIHFVDLRDAGDPVENASFYQREGADELAMLDIAATLENRKTRLEWVRNVAALSSGLSSHNSKTAASNSPFNHPLLDVSRARIVGIPVGESKRPSHARTRLTRTTTCRSQFPSSLGRHPKFSRLNTSGSHTRSRLTNSPPDSRLSCTPSAMRVASSPSWPSG
jgi:hypothetical protein